MQPTLQWRPDQPPALDPDAVISTLRPFGLEAAAPADVSEGRDWAAGLIGPGIATAQVIARVHDRMGGAALFVRREPAGTSDAALTGVLAWIALSGAGLDAIGRGRFSGQDPDLRHVAAPGQRVAAGYGWGIAAAHKIASRTVLGATAALNFDLFPSLPFFTRAATPDGRRVIVERFGYEPAPGGDPDVFWKPAGRERAA